MTGTAGLLAITLLIADCVTVDRCLLARSIVRYAQHQISAAEVRRQLQPSVVPCDPSCNPATAQGEFYAAVQSALPMLGEQLRGDAADSWGMGMGLRAFVDGGLLEDLDTTLAGAIEAQPRSFLRTAQSRSDKSVASIALMLGPSFVDVDVARRCKAYRQRLASIASVRDEELHEVRSAVERALLAVLEPCG